MKSRILISAQFLWGFSLLVLLLAACQKENSEKLASQDPQLKTNSSGYEDGGGNGGFVPIITFTDVSYIDAENANSGGVASLRGGSPPITSKGVVWGTYYFPTLETAIGHTDEGPGPGTFVSKITGLTPGTLYYVCAYATNRLGTNYTIGEFIALSDFASSGSCPSEFTDSRDGKVYHGVQIGEQCWMKENLNYGTRINIGSFPANNSAVEKYCYNNQEANCSVYGGLYSWDEMMSYSPQSNSNPSGVQGVCPAGWHIPSNAEATQLKFSLGGYSNAGGKMKESGYVHWKKPNLGATNTAGFTALGSGYIAPDGSFNQLIVSSFWTTGQYYYQPQSKWYSWTMQLNNMYSSLDHRHFSPDMGMPVRCIKDNTTP